MIIALCIAAGVCVYALVGWAAAVQRLPRAWRYERESWGAWSNTYHASAESNIRDGVRTLTLFMFFCWPIAFPVSLLYDYLHAHPPRNILEAMIDRYDPERNKPCPEPPEPMTLLQPKEPLPDTSRDTRHHFGLRRSGNSKQHSRS